MRRAPIATGKPENSASVAAREEAEGEEAMSPTRLEPGRTLWQLGSWRCEFSGTAVLLYAGDAKVALVYAHGRREVESIAGKWQRAVQEIVRLEKPPVIKAHDG